MIRMNADALLIAMSRRGLSNYALSQQTGVNEKTIAKAKKGLAIRNDCFEAIVGKLGGNRDAYLAHAQSNASNGISVFGMPPTSEWEVDDSIPCSGWHKTANGLQYCVCRMRHLTLGNHFGRGKFYWLVDCDIQTRQELKQQLERHAVVGMTVKPSPHFLPLYSCVAAEGGWGWWVIDRWVDGESLEEQLTSGPWPRKTLPWLMKEILNGLSVLHSHDIVMRELTPARVLIPATGGLPVLTDFELAKLLKGAPTVKTGLWPENPFRADEVEEGEVTSSTDLYSWAMLLLNAATGEIPDVRRLKHVVSAANLPEDVTTVVRECLAAPSRRPKTSHDALQRLRKWR